MNPGLILLIDRPLAGNGSHGEPCKAVPGHPVAWSPAGSSSVAERGVRQMTWHLQNVGPAMKVKRILRLTRLMPIRCPLSRACEHAYPCSGRGIALRCPEGVPEARHRHARKGHRPPSIYWAGCGWTDPARSPTRACKQALPGSGCADVTWPRMRRGGADFAVEGLNEAIHRLGPPEVLNTEHGRAIDSSGPTPPRAGNRPAQRATQDSRKSAQVSESSSGSAS